MLFKQTALFTFSVVFAAAVPNTSSGVVVVPETPEGLVVLEQTPVGSGFLTVYGDEAIHGSDGHKLIPDSLVVPETEESNLDKRQCGTNNINCFGSNVPSSNSCNALINTLSNTGGTGLPQSPRSICLTVDNSQCCVSWANPVSNALRAHLVSAARAVLNSCVNGGSSGLTRNTLIGSTCTTQCLSNRASGCS